MTPVEENLLSVLRSELWQTPLQLSLSPKEAKELLDEAREHAVETIAARALVDNNIPIGKQLVPRCLYALQHTREGNDHLNREISRFASFIERQGLSLAVVKGQVSGTFYAHPEVRNPGDVDFYCDAENFLRVKEVVEKQIGKTIPDTKEKHINFQGNGVEYEMHHRLADFYYAPHQRYFSEVVDKALRERPMRVKINGVDIPTLPPDLNVLFTYIHMFFHLIRGGVGIRQVCDLACSLHALRNELDTDLLRQHLKALGMVNGFRAFGWILIHRLGLPAEDFPYTLTQKDARRGERAYRAVMHFGNFGRKNKPLVKEETAAYTVQKALVVLKQSLLFFDFAPTEMAFIFPVHATQRTKELFEK